VDSNGSKSSKKFLADMPSQAEDIIITTKVKLDSTKVALGIAILFSPRGIGGCSISSGVSDIQDLVTLRCKGHQTSRLAFKGLKNENLLIFNQFFFI
jgi:hypothetical protein